MSRTCPCACEFLFEERGRKCGNMYSDSWQGTHMINISDKVHTWSIYLTRYTHDQYITFGIHPSTQQRSIRKYIYIKLPAQGNRKFTVVSKKNNFKRDNPQTFFKPSLLTGKKRRDAYGLLTDYILFLLLHKRTLICYAERSWLNSESFKAFHTSGEICFQTITF